MKYFQDLKLELFHTLDEFGMDEVAEGLPAPAKWRKYPWALKIVLTRRVKELTCKVIGHDLHDDGWAGPDSGCIDVNCHRCGWSTGKKWLY